jgi:succinate-semialdehyde dehydrogenase
MNTTTTENSKHTANSLQISEMIFKAREAQRTFETFSQQDTDSIVRAIGKYVYDNAEPLSQMAIEDTGIGNLPDKIIKSRSKSATILNSLKGKKSRGIIDEDAAQGIIFVAKPIDVVGAITPITNPIVTPMCNKRCMQGKSSIGKASWLRLPNKTKFAGVIALVSKSRIEQSDMMQLFNTLI